MNNYISPVPPLFSIIVSVFENQGLITNHYDDITLKKLVGNPRILIDANILHNIKSHETIYADLFSIHVELGQAIDIPTLGIAYRIVMIKRDVEFNKYSHIKLLKIK